jgi:hypothetical protein
MPIIVKDNAATISPVACVSSSSEGEIYIYEGVTFCVRLCDIVGRAFEQAGESVTITAGAAARLGLLAQNGEYAAGAVQAARIRETCDEIRDLLVRKNASYGNSAGDPLRVFSTADAVEGLKVRIDDKLSRLSRGTEYAGEDTLLDLAGYFVLLLIETRKARAQEGAPDGNASEPVSRR